MKFSLRWLRDHLDYTGTLDALLERLTSAGIEVEGVEKHGMDDPNLVVAEVISYVPHPNADRLRLCQVRHAGKGGEETRQIVCGAKNFEAGDRVVLALPGVDFGGGFVIKESKLRGELSQGMMCSAKELGLAADADGLLILPKETPFGPLSAVLPADTFIDVEITPNRPDLLSYQGLAWELSALGLGTWRPKETIALSSVAQPTHDWKIDLQAPDLGPRYTLAILENVKVGPSPAWLKEKIEATGHRSINNVVDITNYILWETGQPLHAFDAAKLAGKTIEVRRARKGETLLALDDKTYTLNENDLVIADAERPHALAGVIGGKDSAVTEATTTVALEAAWFDPASVRRSGRRLGILTDSAYRFERRVDAYRIPEARIRALVLLEELADAELIQAPIDAGQAPAKRAPITLRPERVAAVLGAPITLDEITAVLKPLGLRYKGDNIWTSPPYRHDLETEIDLIEEVARVRGLANLPGRVRHGWAAESAADRAWDKALLLRRSLAARGWQEILTEAMAAREAIGNPDAELLALGNPLNAQFTHLRPALKDGLAAIAGGNVARGNLSLRLFEVGKVYRREGGQVVEEMRLGVLQLGPVDALEWAAAERASDFYDVKGLADYLEGDLGIPAAARLELAPLDPATAKRHDLKAKAFYVEYRLDGWLAASDAPALFTGLPQFPGVRRDVALVVPSATPQAELAAALEKAAREAAGSALQKVALFDLFEDSKGEKLAAGKKSLAYALTYRLPDRTLTDKEVNGWQEKILAAVKGLGYDLR
ncbi:phenylalanyl-tRNA synthetase beta subunit [Verrucomicrobium sp. GAS474]|uniref:phenylalanine--tRNA ligase subunit beta n=1 Tax=Verrucomicrobium sp. GAS474 TaxID=1882831 RepID=UPI00087B7685|nr:phenylalanine--tRNA ligase subunit beta [Verrucomicrobium sp. GAS474]SDT96556.1 phenylalanyl-tRNA synthetase beta subunit [Verrucomicrobium sp. GAS474]